MRQELQFVLRLAQELPARELASLLGEIEEVRCTAFARLTAPIHSSSAEPDQLLSIGEAASRLNVSQDYLYRHNKELPFTRRIGRRLLFSKFGYRQAFSTARRLDSTTA